MGDANREELERLWSSRVKDARLLLAFARNYLKEIQRAYPLGDPSPDGQYALQQALRAEHRALANYHRVLRLYSDLTQHGKLPDEDGWRKDRQ